MARYLVRTWYRATARITRIFLFGLVGFRIFGTWSSLSNSPVEGHMIRRIVLMLIILLTSSTREALAEGDSLRVLLIGNSYTYSNEMPGMLADLGRAAGRRMRVAQSTFGGYTLAWHLQNPQTRSRLLEERWDYVVLQEHSLIPTIDSLEQNMMVPAVRELDRMIRSRGARTVLFLTWGRHYGGSHEWLGSRSPNFLSYREMQDKLTEAYKTLAEDLSATLSPVGLAWERAFDLDPTLDLWSSDDSHPSRAGSYLAACTLYATLTQDPPLGLEAHAGLSSQVARFLQYAACRQVLPGSCKEEAIPLSFKTLICYPNPFNSQTSIRYFLPEAARVLVEIHDLKGGRVASFVNDVQNPGFHTISWNGQTGSGGNAGSGAYICTVTNGRESSHEVLLKLD